VVDTSLVDVQVREVTDLWLLCSNFSLAQHQNSGVVHVGTVKGLGLVVG